MNYPRRLPHLSLLISIYTVHLFEKLVNRRFQEVLFGSKPVSLELFFSMITCHDRQKIHLRWRVTELRFYGSEESVLRVRSPGRWTPIWALTKKRLQAKACNLLSFLQRATGFEPATLSLGRDFRISVFNGGLSSYQFVV
jgi:hypothetical protein